MPPALGDHEARRLAVSEAVWRVLAAKGFGGLRLRAIAAEMGASTGLLTHYFPTKRALLVYALDLLDQRNEERKRNAEPTEEGLPTLRAMILDVLPLDAESIASNRIWVGSWDVALADPEFGAEHDRRYARARDRLRTHIEAAQRLGQLPASVYAPASAPAPAPAPASASASASASIPASAPIPASAAVPASSEDIAAGLQGFYLGLIVQSLLAPAQFPPQRQIALVDGYLVALTGPPASPLSGPPAGPPTG